MSEQSGTIGMSPRKASSGSDLFIEKMKKDGVIKAAIFSLMVGIGGGQPSKMTLGGYDLNQYAIPGQNLTFHKIQQESLYWMVTLQCVTLDKDSNESLGNDVNIIIDSGTSFITMTEKDRN